MRFRVTTRRNGKMGRTTDNVSAGAVLGRFGQARPSALRPSALLRAVNNHTIIVPQPDNHRKPTQYYYSPCGLSFRNYRQVAEFLCLTVNDGVRGKPGPKAAKRPASTAAGVSMDSWRSADTVDMQRVQDQPLQQPHAQQQPAAVAAPPDAPAPTCEQQPPPPAPSAAPRAAPPAAAEAAPLPTTTTSSSSSSSHDDVNDESDCARSAPPSPAADPAAPAPPAKKARTKSAVAQRGRGAPLQVLRVVPVAVAAAFPPPRLGGLGS